ncbi:hypothetical protein [Pedobacter lusitanus]|uniref:hypothetical protein n=1 Tax=Pedobacter lusitanus TaxID=1503925 RepID=UPI000A8B628A|nr:hypothetical protein [Pedobacter lusitanus]
MIKKALIIVCLTLLTASGYSQTNTGTVTSFVTIAEGTTNYGFLGRGTTITGAWNPLPNLLTLTYEAKDFAIGGWAKSNNNWMGASLFINSDNGNVGLGTTSPEAKLHVNGATITNLVSFTEGTNPLGYLGRGTAITGAWGQTPDILALTYQGRDFVIGGWGKTSNNWMGASLFINSDNSNVGIGTVKPDAKLTVAGNIHSQEVKVSVDAGADFVFQKDYQLKPLEEVAAYIRDKNHLPEIASADEMKKNGLELGQMNIKLLQKIEELTLYMIDIKEQLESVKRENKMMKEEMTGLKNK